MHLEKKPGSGSGSRLSQTSGSGSGSGLSRTGSTSLKNIQGSQRSMTLEATFASIKDSTAVPNQIKLINIEILIGLGKMQHQ